MAGFKGFRGSKGFRGGGIALRAMSMNAAYRRRAACGSENLHNRASPDGNAPLSPPTAVLPPKGETTHYILCVALLLQNVFAVHPGGGSLLYVPLSANLSCSKHSAAKISPSGGDAAAGSRRGAFSRAKGAVVWFSNERSEFGLFSYGR